MSLECAGLPSNANAVAIQSVRNEFICCSS
jgi:hypothetical protein